MTNNAESVSLNSHKERNLAMGFQNGWPMLGSLFKTVIQLYNKCKKFCVLSSSWPVGEQRWKKNKNYQKIASTLLEKQANNYKINIGSRTI